MESISNITRRTSSTIFRTDSTTAGSSELSELDKQGRRNIKGSILLNLVIGSGFCWGSITTYVASYFKYVVGQEDVNLAQNTYALTFFRIFTMIFMLALPKLTAKYEGKSIILCAAIIIMVGLVGSALLCQTFLSFQIVFGIT
jgi:Na+/melibiose symporter-like transporter